MTIKKRYVSNLNKREVATMVLDSIVSGSTNPTVTILNLRKAIDTSKEEPSPETLAYGQLAINYDSNKEKIFIKNSADKVISFDASHKMFSYIDEADEILQSQIDTINGDETVEGSFSHADKVLKDELTEDINERVLSVTGVKGVRSTTDASNNVTVEGVVKMTDNILSVDNSGFSATVYATYDWESGSVKLFGKNQNKPLSEFKIQTGEKLLQSEAVIGVGNETPNPLIQGNLYIKYSFGTDGEVHEVVYCDVTSLVSIYSTIETDTIESTINKVDPTHYTIESNVKVSGTVSSINEHNAIQIKPDGLFVSDVHDSGTYTNDTRENKDKLQVLRSDGLNESPLPSTLLDGELAINTYKDNEKIYFKNSQGDELAVFDTTENILKIVDEKIANEIKKLTDPNNPASLQYQINYEVSRAKYAEDEINKKIEIINGNEATEGSFTHADKVLENKLMLLINDITGSTGETTVTIIGGVTDTASNTFDTNTNTLSTNVLISTEDGNHIEKKSDGLYAHINSLDGGEITT